MIQFSVLDAWEWKTRELNVYVGGDVELRDKCTWVGEIIQKQPSNSSSKEKSAICLTTNESRRVYRDTTMQLIVACSSWRQWATPYHGCSRRGTVTYWRVKTAAEAAATRMKRMRRHQRQCTKRKVKKFWTKSDRCPFFTTPDGSNDLLYEPIHVVNFSVNFYCLVAHKIAARPIPSVRPCVCLRQDGALRKQWEIDLSPPGYSKTPSSASRQPFPQTRGLQPLVKTCIAYCG